MEFAGYELVGYRAAVYPVRVKELLFPPFLVVFGLVGCWVEVGG